MDARSIIATCDEWPPLSALGRLTNANNNGGMLSSSPLVAQLAAALPPCTAQSRFTELCFGRHSGLATAVVANIYTGTGHIRAALSDMHNCADLYLHTADLKARFGPERFEVVQFASLKPENMVNRSRDILPRVRVQSLIVVTSLLQSLVQMRCITSRQALEHAVSWVCR